MKNTVNTGIVTVGTAAITTLLGAWDNALEILLIVMALDYITGIIAAFMQKKLKASTGYEGLIKKGSMFLVVILAAQVDRLTGNSNTVFRTCTAFFFIANESLSVIENAREIGIELPAFLEKYIRRIKKENNDHTESLTNNCDNSKEQDPQNSSNDKKQ